MWMISAPGSWPCAFSFSAVEPAARSGWRPPPPAMVLQPRTRATLATRRVSPRPQPTALVAKVPCRVPQVDKTEERQSQW